MGHLVLPAMSRFGAAAGMGQGEVAEGGGEGAGAEGEEEEREDGEGEEGDEEGEEDDDDEEEEGEEGEEVEGEEDEGAASERASGAPEAAVGSGGSEATTPNGRNSKRRRRRRRQLSAIMGGQPPEGGGSPSGAPGAHTKGPEPIPKRPHYQVEDPDTFPGLASHTVKEEGEGGAEGGDNAHDQQPQHRRRKGRKKAQQGSALGMPEWGKLRGAGAEGGNAQGKGGNALRLQPVQLMKYGDLVGAGGTPRGPHRDEPPVLLRPRLPESGGLSLGVPLGAGAGLGQQLEASCLSWDTFWELLPHVQVREPCACHTVQLYDCMTVHVCAIQ